MDRHTRTSSVPPATNTSPTTKQPAAPASHVHSRNGSFPITNLVGGHGTPSSARPGLNLATPPPRLLPFPGGTPTTPQATDSPTEYFQQSPTTPYTPGTPDSGTSLRRSGAIGHSRSSSRSSSIAAAAATRTAASSRRNSLTASASASAAASPAAAIKRQSSAAFFTASRSSSSGSSVAGIGPPRHRTTSSGGQAATVAAPEPASHALQPVRQHHEMAIPSPPPKDVGHAFEDNSTGTQSRTAAAAAATPPALPASIAEQSDSPQRSTDSLQMPDVPRRRSSVHRLRLKDTGRGSASNSPSHSPLPSPLPFSPQENNTHTPPPIAKSPPAPVGSGTKDTIPRVTRSTTADSSDLSDYGSQADEDELYEVQQQMQGLSAPSKGEGGSASAHSDVYATAEADLSDAIKLTGGPPKLQRRQRDARAATASASSTAASSSGNDTSVDSSVQGGKRSHSPRKPRMEPEERDSREVAAPAGMSPPIPQADATPLARKTQLPSKDDPPEPSSPTRSKMAALQTARPHGRDEDDNDDDRVLEAEAQRLADLENPDRPRTLKEARELAKARAQARKVQPSVAAAKHASSSSLSRPDLQTSYSNSSVMSELQAAVGDAIQDFSFDIRGPDDAELRQGASSPETRGVLDMSGDRGDVASDSSHRSSYDSAWSADEPDSDVRSGAPAATLPVSGSARTIKTDQKYDGQVFRGYTRQEGDEGEGMSLDEALGISAPATPRPPEGSQKNAGAIPAYLTSAKGSSPVNNYRLAQAPYAGVPPQVQPRSSSSIPTQRTFINLDTRIPVPGKTVPFPPAMNAQSISIDKRKLPPWERARTYAAFVNELASIPSGLAMWMEMTQKQPRSKVGTVRAVSGLRPGGGVMPRYPSTFHAGGEGLMTGDSSMSSSGMVHPRDASGASARSDMTFPMRGDGGRARDVTQVPLDQNSMPDAVPANIPYPTLVHQPHSNQGSLSSRTGAAPPGSGEPTPTSSTGRAAGLRARKLSNHALDALNPFGSGYNQSGQQGQVSPPASHPAGAAAASIRAGLLSSLGRRGSKRNATIHPSMTNSSMSSVGSSGSVSGPRGPRSAVAKGATRAATVSVNSPGQFYSSPSSSSVIDLGAMAKDPEQAGLGLGLTRSPGDEGIEQGLPPAPQRSVRQTKSSTMLNVDSAANAQQHAQQHPQRSSPSLSPGPRRGSGTGTDHGASGTSGGGLLNSLRVSPASTRKNSAASSSSESPHGMSESFRAALQRVADVLPDADEDVLVGYVKRAQGDDLKAIGDYLNDSALGNVRRR